MFGRLDIIRTGICKVCNGKKTDPKNRKRQCSECGGDGKHWLCTTCNQIMPCKGTDNSIMDQSYCMSDKNDFPCR